MRTKSGLHIVTNDRALQEEAGERPLRCGLCPASFRKDQLGAFDRHVASCARSERADQMEAHGPHRNPILRDTGDLELAAFIRANSRAIVEGRVKL